MMNIKDYDIFVYPIKDIINWIESGWEYATQGYFKKYQYANKIHVQLHTAGWSDNEDTYYQFEKIKGIKYFWKKSEAGGHYYYEFPLDAWEYGINKACEMRKNEI